MKWLFVIDPIEKLNPATDTTYAIMQESSGRNINCFIAQINDIFFDRKSKVNAAQISFKAMKRSIGKKSVFMLDDFELIFMRKEPPYNMQFHYATILLSLSGTTVVNDPRALRDFNEKLIALNFLNLMPKTIVTYDKESIIKFVKKNEHAVLKSLDSYQGKFVRKVQGSDKDLMQTVSGMTMNGAIPIMVQEFLLNVHKGDKRILMLNGKIIGAVNRIPKEGSFISNFAGGGKGVKTKITGKDKMIADSVCGFLVKNGIHFAGLDVIDGLLTEINITCPTGVAQINLIENKKLEKDIVDYFEKVAK